MLQSVVDGESLRLCALGDGTSTTGVCVTMPPSNTSTSEVAEPQASSALSLGVLSASASADVDLAAPQFNGSSAGLEARLQWKVPAMDLRVSHPRLVLAACAELQSDGGGCIADLWVETPAAEIVTAGDEMLHNLTLSAFAVLTEHADAVWQNQALLDSGVRLGARIALQDDNSGESYQTGALTLAEVKANSTASPAPASSSTPLVLNGSLAVPSGQHAALRVSAAL
eukprot:6503622-Prymnesium_polylepis.1